MDHGCDFQTTGLDNCTLINLRHRAVAHTGVLVGKSISAKNSGDHVLVKHKSSRLF